jgi:hypothetical protein
MLVWNAFEVYIIPKSNVIILKIQTASSLRRPRYAYFLGKTLVWQYYLFFSIQIFFFVELRSISNFECPYSLNQLYFLNYFSI